VVTGANRGIGSAVSRALCRTGLHVVVTGRSEARAEALASELSAAGLQASSHELDVRDPGSVVRVMADTYNRFGRLDVLINNAGIVVDRGQAAATPDFERVNATLDTNLIGAWRCAAAAVTEMRKTGYGRIVNVTSHQGSMAAMGAGDVAYRVSKAGLNALTKILAAELKDGGILVNAASPGRTKTRMGVKSATKSPEEVTETFVWLATLPDDGPTGQLFYEMQPLEWLRIDDQSLRRPMISGLLVVEVGAAVFLGALVQACLGLGIGLLVAPVLAILDSSLLPGALLVLGLLLPVMTLIREGQFIDWRGLKWILGGRVAGTLCGSLILLVLSPQWIRLGVGIVLLCAVIAGALKTAIRENNFSLIIGGALAGITATVTGIAGPSVAMVYRESSKEALRATLAAYFIVGASLSIVAVSITGNITGQVWLYAVIWIPFLVGGFLCSNLLEHWIEAVVFRRAILVISCCSGIYLVTQSIFAWR
jgi:NAD(P)-dependent dehydrogenase (short-subunit alcohol dehydrogenase family)/uncharacterized membrane protein YfcA